MDLLGRTDVSLLALMFGNILIVIPWRFYCHVVARWQSRIFIRDASPALERGALSEIIALARLRNQSHTAAVIASGLMAFACAPPDFTSSETVARVERAIRRCRKVQSARLSVGLGTLKNIASTAPFIGLIGTCEGIMYAFRGAAMEKSALFARTTSDISMALTTTAMGLLVAIPAQWAYNYFFERVQIFESEMSNAALETVTCLNAHPRLRHQPGIAALQEPVFLSLQDARHSWEVPYDHQRELLLTVGCCGFFALLVIGMAADWSFLWRRNQIEDYAIRGWTGGQALLSPDRHYRAVTPLSWYDNSNVGDQYSICGTNKSALLIIPNDRPPSWKSYTCGRKMIYALEPNESLQMSTCALPLAMWRTNDELLVEFRGHFPDDLQLTELDSFPRKIEVAGPDGKPVHPKVVPPPSPCTR